MKYTHQVPPVLPERTLYFCWRCKDTVLGSHAMQLLIRVGKDGEWKWKPFHKKCAFELAVERRDG